MPNPGISASPAVHLCYYHSLVDSNILRQICLGLEEQGVPCRLQPCSHDDSALAYARAAAARSALQTGLGVNVNGEVVLTHQQYPADRALRRCSPGSSSAQWRNIGANAGQLVKVIPFSEAQ
ncbi:MULTISPECIES: glycerol dehydratase reactivase beta/small subunit family protein [Enterobacteriaceae]|uniref:glycerol dehydratase reactivase beta/small subunit family protein n=1 Tax=Enterobacteriaceae TaxID=543 RepID=UPI0015DC4A92|nr:MULTISPECIES: glycerol dehydratase reactivase beta/small subunit family protein [unclassified Klebsiella]BBS92420.1 hypothetical protein WP7S18C02_30350 [Klebsiella sp. WP7-S18-CRE-02]BBS97450.1 hypothetical protein WP7S18C03_30430 [Klebsiella sp. WP7-S18-CRE-03]BBT02517.1 hypothetical protein WP7S18E04_30790 [Klebsiella sp. WP7-S18-ESBL-04]